MSRPRIHCTSSAAFYPSTFYAFAKSLYPNPQRHITLLFDQTITDIQKKAIGASQDAARMERVVNFYAGLPRGPAPQVKPTGIIGRYQARYFSGKNASGAREYREIIR